MIALYQLLSEHNGASFLQVDIQGVVSMVQHQVPQNSKQFDGAKKAIDDMIAQFTAEKQNEIKHKDWYVDEIQ